MQCSNYVLVLARRSMLNKEYTGKSLLLKAPKGGTVHKSHLLGTKLHMAEKHVLLVVKLALSPRMQHLANERHCYLVTH